MIEMIPHFIPVNYGPPSTQPITLHDGVCAAIIVVILIVLIFILLPPFCKVLEWWMDKWL